MPQNASGRPHRPAAVAAALVAALVALVAAGCGSSGSSSGASGSSTTTGPKTPVSLALDWTPNTNHIGAYVAQQKGWYSDAGLDVKILPYAQTPPETLIANGKADLGFSYQAGTAYAHASGQDVKQVLNTIGKTQYAIGVKADRTDITSPKDLDGKTYAGFGTPDEGPEIAYVIKKDGGTGKFKTVALSTSAYDAVYNGRADFTIPATTWEGIEAQEVGKPLKYFQFTDFGFPAQYSSTIASSDKWLKANPDVAKAFLAATKKGYDFARDNPAEAAKLLIAANPQAFKNPELVTKSAQVLSDEGYYGDGTISPDVWDKYGSFLFDKGLLTGADGKPLTQKPDFSQYWTNDYVPQG